MEALSFFKFWRPTDTTQKENKIFGGNSNVDADDVPKLWVCSEGEFDEGDDSFFELELTISDFDNKKITSSYHKESNGFDSNNYKAQQQQLHYLTKNAGHGDLNRLSQQQTTKTLSMSSTDILSKRKILPIEPTSSSSSNSSSRSKPQSPIALLKSAPKLRVPIFRKSKSMATAALKTEKTEIPASKIEQNRRHFTFTFKLQEAPTNRSMFTRACSLRKTHHSITDEASSSSSSSCDRSSKRFSKDVIQKYLKLIRPLYVKVSKKNDKMGFSGELTEAPQASSPANLPACSLKKEKQGNVPSGFRAVSRHLGKSKSASAAFLSPARRDDSLLLQHDGIQSAILHCKKSLNSRDSSSLSRSTSCSSQETFSNLSSKDSSLLSRFSNSSTEEFISSRKSNEVGI